MLLSCMHYLPLLHTLSHFFLAYIVKFSIGIYIYKVKEQESTSSLFLLLLFFSRLVYFYVCITWLSFLCIDSEHGDFCMH